MKLKLTASAIALALTFSATAAELKTFTAGEKAVAADVNANFTAVDAAATAAATAAAAAQTNADTANTAAATAQAAAEAAQAAAETAQAAADTNTDAIAANSTTVNSIVTDIQANADAIMAAKTVEWQMVSEEGTVVGTVVNKEGTVYTLNLAGENSGNLVRVDTANLSKQIGMNTYSDIVNSVPDLHPDGQWGAAMWYTTADCTGAAHIATGGGSGWVDSNWTNFLPQDELWSTSAGEAVVALYQNGELYTVSIDSNVVTAPNGETEMMSRSYDGGVSCTARTGSKYSDYVEVTNIGAIDGLFSEGTSGQDLMGNTTTYTQIDLGNFSIVRK